MKISRSGRLAAVIVSAALAAGALLGAGTAHADPQVVSIDAGGATDAYFTGGLTAGTGGQVGNPNWPGGVTHPLPNSTWETYRYLESTYTVTGLAPGTSYETRLYFLDWYWTRVGQRIFDVKINGTTVLANFDVIKAAVDRGGDGTRLGIEKTFTATANSSGIITIDFVRGPADQPLINAIALVPIV